MGKTELRRRLLNRRRRIPQGEARRAAAAASLGAWRLRAMARARRIAVYFPVSHELDCRPLMEQAWARGRELYLPVLHGKRLRFRRYEPGTRLLPNRFGIPEPDCQTELGPTAIDVAITPLVGFDRAGNRLAWAAVSTTGLSISCTTDTVGVDRAWLALPSKYNA